MNQTKIYAIFITAVLLLWWPAWYFFITQDMTHEIQQKDEKISKALDTLKKAKTSIEKKDEKIKTQSWKILECNNLVEKKDWKIQSLKADLKNAYAWITDDVISTEGIIVKESDANLSTWAILENSWAIVWEKSIIKEDKIKEIAKNNCPVCEKCENINAQSVKPSWNSFDEKNVLETMDLAYNKWLWKKWVPYIQWPSKSLLEMYNWDNEVLKAKVWYYCWDDYLEDDFYWNAKKSIVRSYERAYCKDEKYENCPKEIKAKIDKYKSKKILPTEVIRILTKYDEKNPSDVSQEMFAVYNDFWKRVCSWIRNTDYKWHQKYIQVR